MAEGDFAIRWFYKNSLFCKNDNEAKGEGGQKSLKDYDVFYEQSLIPVSILNFNQFYNHHFDCWYEFCEA